MRIAQLFVALVDHATTMIATFRCEGIALRWTGREEGARRGVNATSTCTREKKAVAFFGEKAVQLLSSNGAAVEWHLGRGG